MNYKSSVVKVGSLMMGGDWPVSIQTMWKDPLPVFSGENDLKLRDVLSGIEKLEEIGCDVLRFAVPDEASADSLGAIAAKSPLPLVADIHFDWRLALRCMDYPIAKIRINPGNIGARWKTAEVVAKAKDKEVALRIGVNAGSLPADLRDGEDIAAACVTAAEREMAVFEELGFSNLVVSMKLNEPGEVERANRLFASKFDYPLHLGVTEAGPLISGIARNTAALVPLLKDGIGATIRVSLSASMESEVIAAREILGCAGLRRTGVRIVSCPRCGRASFDTHAFLARWSDRLYSLKAPIEVAIMGCVVNGPGEARHADIGITGAGDFVLIFRKGQEPQKVRLAEADEAFEEELRKSVG
ncbi:MAG TPA: flavodoxin-dependent (E)-4-hydroxy-3-methylbut-2-enyl-diphosphate synthase [Rectinemataceae bacterium]|nr:flavodoxin-dependent (E)-4-hydroxy-3-methylbut-2-enyl-diphosphate synthase [Rectinemataceae bacterium]